MTDDEAILELQKRTDVILFKSDQEHLEMRRLPPFAGKTAGRSDWFMAEE